LVLQELLRVNQSLVRNDLATRDVTFRTEAELAELAGQDAELAQQALIAQAAINQLLARDLTIPIRTDFTSDDLDTILLLTTPEELLGRAIQDRPELAQIEAGLISLAVLNDLQQASRQPTLGAQVFAGLQGGVGTDEFENQPYVTLGLGFTWNLYDGKKRSIQQQQNQLQAEQLLQRKDEVNRSVQLQAWQALQRVQSARASLIAAEAGRKASEENFRIVAARYRNQQAILIEWLDARNQWTSSQLEYNLRWYRLLQEYAALEAAVGKE
ncbi:MAG: TolC family protein, partial [Bacteroidota bacterium]